MLLDVLFIFCKLNPDVGYRQGMHEVLAPILWVVERDAIDLGESSKILGEDALVNAMFDAEHIEHDAFALFGQIMQSAKNFYEQTTVSGRENPMVARSRRIFNDLLPLVDERLAKHLESIDVVPQVFLMRWIRLLFGREFAFDDMLTVWDVIFAEDTTLEVVDHICLAMLLRIHWDLVEADYNVALTLLLKYPAPGKELPPQTFVLDALYLREHMDHHSGSYLVSKYTGRPIQRAGRPVTPPALQRKITTFSGPNASKSTSTSHSPSPSGTPRQSRNLEAVLQSTARNIYARGEKLAIGKAVRNAVDEVHRKAQEIRDIQTPSPPVMPRQRASNSLQSRLKASEDRSKQLARLLEGAVSELWAYQKLAAESTQSTHDDKDALNVEKLSVAIAKVQFVQVYLDDPGLPIPADPDKHDSDQEGAGQTTLPTIHNDTHDESTSTIPSGTSSLTGQHATKKNSQPLQSTLSHDTSSQPRSENLADPSTFEDFSAPSPQPQTQIPKVVIQPGEDPFGSKAAASPGSSSKPERSSSRPRLAQSPFSWMLGEQDSSAGTFHGSSSPRTEREESQGLLFDGLSKTTNAENSRRPGEVRSSKKANDAAGQSSAEGFDFGALRHSRGKDG